MFFCSLADERVPRNLSMVHAFICIYMGVAFYRLCLFVNKKSLLEQREVGRDANTFSQAIEYFSESDVDVMAVSDNSESGVIPLILEFASSGRLVIFQMDTTSVIQTVEEVFAGFDQKSQQRAGLLLAEGLRAIICQKLVLIYCMEVIMKYHVIF